EESRAVARRKARQLRRQGKRRVMRMIKVGELLQKAGLLPPGNLRDSVERDTLFKVLDRTLREQYADRGFDAAGLDGIRGIAYFLRARALYEPLEPYALGRAIYHLAMRRGFLSNRKAPMKKDEEEGEVKKGISELEQEIRAKGALTLGEYFYKVDPVQEKRIRKRWTARQMYQQEFEIILARQQEFGSISLAPKTVRKLYKAIFRQRPLKSQRGTVGPCSLEPKETRAPWHSLLAQEFRLLQKINDLKLISPEQEKRKLTEEERKKLYDYLMEHAEISFPALLRELGLKSRDGWAINLTSGEETRLKGNEVASRLIEIFGRDRWLSMSDAEKAQLINELNSNIKDAKLLRRAREVWKLDEENAQKLVSLRLPQGYCSLSRTALKKIVPLMRQGLDYATAVEQAYGKRNHRIYDLLPPFLDVDRTLRSPVVIRTLTETRKVVNEIIRKFGKPDRIHIELAREMKQSRKRREKRMKEMREREKQRSAAREAIKNNLRLDPNAISARDIEKWLLAEECGWICPYSGKAINYHNLFGPQAEFDIEHILPYSKSLDNSFVNKTLCHREWNLRKGNRTPAQAFKDTPEWPAMLQRVRAFRPLAAVNKPQFTPKGHPDIASKLELFMKEEIPPDFVDQKMNDTRHASVAAKRYLELLYPQDERLKRIKAFSGGVTAELRKCWKLNSILGDPESPDPRKNRADHRHHAIDALVLALATPGMVKYLSDAVEKQQQCQRSIRGYQKWVEEPWSGFLDDVRNAVSAIVVSHRVDHRLQGQLHDDTFYSPPRVDENGKTYHVVRKPLDGTFDDKKAKRIEDPKIRSIVLQHLEAHGNDPKKAFNAPANHPRINGVPIHAVRIRDYVKPEKIGKAFCPRYALTDSNHHMEVIEEKDKKGNPVWKGIVVSRYEAMQRKHRGEPIIQRDHGEGKRFVCSIASGDMFSYREKESGPILVGKVRCISDQNIEFVSIYDARKQKEIKSDDGWKKRSINILRTMNFQKVTVSPIGEVYPAND
ncbi:MAG TPA: type II CRISPR RNA-guided endonuclease Cas9, partial [Candidatus Hydrogenedentes bacterium]|nr:type II CRISPR RNA-guided endonuclease Cas9 [Candidatus Hydrogenedentota bacterium]